MPSRIIDLGTARVGLESEAFDISGDFIAVEYIDGVNVDIVFNTLEFQNRYSLNNNRAIQQTFYRLFIINTAQVGKSIKLIWGSGDFSISGITPVKIVDLNGVDVVPLSMAGTPVIGNVTMTNADTEYSYALPANCKKYSIKLRDLTAFRSAYVTGKVATPTAPYLSVPVGAGWDDELIQASALTLFFASAASGKVAEIVAWS